MNWASKQSFHVPPGKGRSTPWGTSEWLKNDYHGRLETHLVGNAYPQIDTHTNTLHTPISHPITFQVTTTNPVFMVALKNGTPSWLKRKWGNSTTNSLPELDPRKATINCYAQGFFHMCCTHAADFRNSWPELNLLQMSPPLSSTFTIIVSQYRGDNKIPEM